MHISCIQIVNEMLINNNAAEFSYSNTIVIIYINTVTVEFQLSFTLNAPSNSSLQENVQETK